jgi:hypothetical protein
MIDLNLKLHSICKFKMNKYVQEYLNCNVNNVKITSKSLGNLKKNVKNNGKQKQ